MKTGIRGLNEFSNSCTRATFFQSCKYVYCRIYNTAVPTKHFVELLVMPKLDISFRKVHKLTARRLYILNEFNDKHWKRLDCQRKVKSSFTFVRSSLEKSFGFYYKHYIVSHILSKNTLAQ